MTNVAVIPPASDLARNGLFENRRQGQGAHSPNVHWLDAFAVAYKKAKELDITLGTDDVLPVEEADIVIYMAQPGSPTEVVELKRKYPRLKAILVLLETSLGARYTFNPRNHSGFDAVVTYDDRLVDNEKYFPLRPRAYSRDRIRTGPSFGERRVGCLVGTNRRMRYRSGIMAMKKGWQFSLNDWLDYVFCFGELMTYRSNVGRLCASYPVGTFDIFGEGWDIHPETRAVCLGIPKTSTLNYYGKYRYIFAFENHSGENSLISERIWDALWGDSVPVYYGNTRLNRYIPDECFIDASSFNNPKTMLDSLVNSSEAEWMEQRQAGRDFILSNRIKKFLPDAVADEFLRPVLQFVGQSQLQESAQRSQYVRLPKA